MCPDLEQTEQQEQLILPRSHLEGEIKLASDKRGICQAWGYSLHTELVPPTAGKKKATAESNKNLLEQGLSELFSSRGQPGKGHWVPPEGLHVPPDRWRGHSQIFQQSKGFPWPLMKQSPSPSSAGGHVGSLGALPIPPDTVLLPPELFPTAVAGKAFRGSSAVGRDLC